MDIFLPGVFGAIVFYLAVLFVGLRASSRVRGHSQEELMLAGRRLGLFIGVLTLIATWVGGGYVNATAEAMFTDGLAWCQVPVGYSLSLLFGALLFVRPMCEATFYTMLDPLQNVYGARVGGLLFLPALFGDVFWCAAVLSALGSSLKVILDLPAWVTIGASAALAACYTSVGGFYSVSYTDALQLACIVLGLVLSLPYALQSPHVDSARLLEVDWIGRVEPRDWPRWLDGLLLLTFGGIPWQGYFQRMLALKNPQAAEHLSLLSMVGCAVMATPAMAMGAVARVTDWSSVEGVNRTLGPEDAYLVLPLVLRYLTPPWVSFFGLGAVSAAVMSSADSSILASSAMFTRNIYKLTIRPTANDEELIWVLRFSVVGVTALAATAAITIGSVYYLSYLCSDLVYVLLFPQLLLTVRSPQLVNTYGCLASFGAGLGLRLLGGEPGLGLPATIRYPLYDEVRHQQGFPHRTTAMLVALGTHLGVSWLARLSYDRGWLRDVLGCFQEKNKGAFAMEVLTVTRQKALQEDTQDASGEDRQPAIQEKSLPSLKEQDEEQNEQGVSLNN